MAPIRPISLQCKVQMPVELAPFCSAQPGPDNFECIDNSDFSHLMNASRLQSSYALFETGTQRQVPVLSAGPSTFSANESGALLLVGIVGLGILAGGWTALVATGLVLLACSPFEKVGDPVDEDHDGFISKQYGGDDCDDSDKNIHPGAAEICNGKDDNCDGNTDEGLLTPFYKDQDNDGYGNKNTSILACTAPASYIHDNKDCDDSNKNIHPGAVEVCGNNKDDNCDNTTDEGCFIERVSITLGGVEGNGGSYRPSISADGRFVAFDSEASNLVPGDTNGVDDVFVRNRQTGTTERVSIGTGGVKGNGGSSVPSISTDGRFVAFASGASNLVAGDTNGKPDIFVRDRQTGTTERVSVNSNGVEGNYASGGSSISADGRFVAFSSLASNLVPGDTNGTWNIFVRDRQTGITERVSVNSNGVEGNYASGGSSISADGRFVAFASLASNLVPGDTNNALDIFVRDRQTGTTERVSIGSGGTEGNATSEYGSSISADGHFVLFASGASNLVPGDTNGKPDIFVHDRQTGTTERINVGPGGVQGNQGSYYSFSISADGRFVAFDSDASNLVPGDTNGWQDIFVVGLERFFGP